MFMYVQVNQGFLLLMFYLSSIKLTVENCLTLFDLLHSPYIYILNFLTILSLQYA